MVGLNHRFRRSRLLWLALLAAIAVVTLLAVPTEAFPQEAVQEIPADPEYRRLPMIGSRVGMWVVGQLHLMFAAFVLAVPLVSLIIEIVGHMKKEKRYDDLAYEFMKLMSVSFSLTASLGALLTIMLVVLYPRLTTYLVSIFSWTFFPYALLFFLEAVFLYSYYYGWGKFSPRVHIALGIGLNLTGLSIMFIANAWLTFMNTPGGISETGALVNLWDAINNYTWMPINIHRTIANVAFGGSIAAAYGAYKYLGAKTPEARAHYDWMAYVSILIAIIALIPLPFAGYLLGKEIYAFSQSLGIATMGGTFSWIFIIQGVLVGNLFLAANYYLWVSMDRIEGAERYRKFIKYLLASIAVTYIVWATPHSLVATVEEARRMGGANHPMLNVLGVMSAKNTAVNVLILTTFVSFLLHRRSDKEATVSWARTGKRVQLWIFIVTTLFVVFLGVYGYFVEARVRIAFSIPQVLSVLLAMISVTVIDIYLFRNARKRGSIRWGEMPARAHYVLFFLAVTYAWTMGIMGYVRGAMRQHWHVYGVMADTSPDAFTPSIGYASVVTSVTVFIFFVFIVFVFWLAGLTGRKPWESTEEESTA